VKLISLVAAVSLLLLTGVRAAETKSSVQVTTEKTWQAALHASDSKGCAEAIGLKPAKAIVRYCFYVSTATHPPCDSTNICSDITDHVAAQFGASAPGEIIPGESTLHGSDWKSISRIPAE
jgi:hypothetical protein